MFRDGYFGVAYEGEASCDYPAESDVRAGVQFGNGVYTGLMSQTNVIVLSRPGVIPSADLIAGTITVRRGDTLRTQITGLGDLADADELWFTAKQATSDADSAAAVQISLAGLLVIDGTAAETAANGSITVDDEAAGDITVFLDELETAKLGDDDSPQVLSRTLQLPIGQYFYDIQKRTADGDTTTLAEGLLKVVSDVTRGGVS